MSCKTISLYDFFYTEKADPRVKDWPLMADPFPTLYILIFYLLFVMKVGPWLMENRKPFQLTNIIRGYNIFQLICCVLLFFGVGSCGWFSGDISFGCESVNYSDEPNAVRLAEYFWWTYCLKIVELIETIFFVLRKKQNQISYLHLYHHTTTLATSWIACKYVAGGMSSFPLMLNCAVHFIMYGYYLLSTFGPEWQNKLYKLKNKITVIQMVQFSIILLHIMQVFIKDCNFPTLAAYSFFPNVVIVFYFFYNFYTEAYSTKDKIK